MGSVILVNFHLWYIYGKEFISEEPEYKLLTFEYQPTDLIFTFREDESPYSWQEAYNEAIANGKRMPIKTELLDYLELQGNQPIYQEDAWCPVIAPEYTNGKDWIYIGNHSITFTGGHFVGKSHTEYHGYPSWGDNANNSYAKFYCEVIEYNQTEYSVNFPEDTECDILIVGGGGGGGKRHGGGGGAGTLIYHKNISLDGTYNIKVGKGGNGVTSGITLATHSASNGATDGKNSELVKQDGAQRYLAVGGGRGTTSDSRMKDNIFKASYKECYDIFKKIELYRYNFKPGHLNSNDRNQLGFIAQEVQQQIPNSVEPRSIRLSSGVYIHDILTLNVTQINYILYGTFKYLIAKLDIIKKHLESQEEAGQTE